jgi:hypothetical protein
MSNLPAKTSRDLPASLFSWQGTIGPVPYAVAGTALLALKYAIDWTVAHFIFHRSWEIWSYFMPGQTLDFLAMSPGDRAFFATILMLALPFIWMGVVLTMRRLRSAGIPVFWVKLFFIPFVNLLLFIMLCVLPHQDTQAVNLVVQTGEHAGERLAAPDMVPAPVQPQRLIVSLDDEKREDSTRALATTVPAALAVAWFGIAFLQSYGWGLFVGVPFLVGMSAAMIAGRRHNRSLMGCLSIACVALSLVGIGMFFFTWEGFGCLLMAAPIAYVLACMGAWLGHSMQAPAPKRIGQAPLLLLLLLATPCLMGAESMVHQEAPLACVKSVVQIDAPPEVVWNNVIAFPQLQPPTEPVFHMGIAYPIGATISGKGRGAVRRCKFSTGAFVEPITVWDPPRLLKFGVIAQPEPMREFSWMHDIHPAHLKGYLDIHGGEFKLVPVQIGDRQATRLEGTTWYENKMWPQAYWNMWTNYLIHRIHMRVLEHIEKQST